MRASNELHKLARPWHCLAFGPDGGLWECKAGKLAHGALASYGTVTVIASWGGKWDHVSVSLASGKIPPWLLMEHIRRTFFRPTETVVQIHPPIDQYMDYSQLGPAIGKLQKHILHLWRPQFVDIPLPPLIFI